VNSASAVVAATTAGSGDDMKKTKYIAKVTSDAVRQSRCEKQLTQKELAQKCNMDVSIVAEIERTYKISVPESELKNMTSLTRVYELVQTHLAAAAG
jgi:ribosome-binding protein aMBF1 (putative translation factor)